MSGQDRPLVVRSLPNPRMAVCRFPSRWVICREKNILSISTSTVMPTEMVISVLPIFSSMDACWVSYS